MTSWSLSRVEVKGIGGIKGESTYEFGKGIFFLKGPNESGKTSLTRAIIWGLTGMCDLELDELLNRELTEGYVKLLIEYEKGKLELIRKLRKVGRKLEEHAFLKLQPTGEEIEGIEDVRMFLEVELGVSPETYYIAFNNARDEMLINLKEGSQLRKYIEIVSRATEYDASLKGMKKVRELLNREWKDYAKQAESKAGAKDMLERIEKDIKRKEAELGKLRHDLEEAKELLEKEEIELENLDKVSLELKRVQKDVSDMERLMKIRMEDLDRASNEIEQDEKSLSEIEAELARLRKSREEMEKLLIHKEEEKSRINEYIEEAERKYKQLESIREQLEEITELLDKKSRCEEKIRELKEALDKITSNLGDVQKEIGTIESELENKNAEVGSMRADFNAYKILVERAKLSKDVCPVCGKAWTLHEQEECIKRLNVQALEKEEKVKEIEVMINELRLRLTELKKQEEELTNTKHKTESEVSKANSELEFLKSKIEKLKTQFPLIPLSLDGAKSALKEIELEIGALEKRIKNQREEMKGIEGEARKLRKEASELDRRISENEGKKISLEYSIKRRSEEVEKLKAELEGCSLRLKDAEQRMQELIKCYDEEEHKKLKEEVISHKKYIEMTRERISEIESDLRKLEEERERYEKDAEEYVRLKREADYLEMASILQDEVFIELAKYASVYLREGVRNRINQIIPNILKELEFEFDKCEVDEDYKLNIERRGQRFSLDMLCEGARNAIGIAIKLAIAEHIYGMPALIIYDDCLSLDDERLRKFIKAMTEKGSSLIITLREETPNGKLIVEHV